MDSAEEESERDVSRRLGTLTHFALSNEYSLLLVSRTLIPVRWHALFLATQGPQIGAVRSPISLDEASVMPCGGVSTGRGAGPSRGQSWERGDSHRMCKSRQVWLERGQPIRHSSRSWQHLHDEYLTIRYNYAGSEAAKEQGREA